MCPTPMYYTHVPYIDTHVPYHVTDTSQIWRHFIYRYSSTQYGGIVSVMCQVLVIYVRLMPAPKLICLYLSRCTDSWTKRTTCTSSVYQFLYFTYELGGLCRWIPHLCLGKFRTSDEMSTFVLWSSVTSLTDFTSSLSLVTRNPR